ncbi:protein SOB FIVE-LIKE 5-like isoform X1 [Arachis stenosperma]|uniref:protein SOB FIVE-LIKE 5-like isoform X1 n=1 Tax=Arachis stenosperma TaxID=217475 RepID=UPI0025AC15A1|nr:protein SOB FIVE-LIKE 5-like isoform X1 [Arachis stenosperma]
MNDAMAASECSSGVESGWTLYLDHSYSINHNSGYYEEDKRRNKHEDSTDEEDLSMVSDASSWPPHDDTNYDENQNNNNNNNGAFCNSASKAVKLSKTKRQKKVKEPSYLHDTASSHFYDLSTNKVDDSNQQTYTQSMLDCSQGFSATYFQRKTSCQEHFGFFQPSLSENELQENNSWYGGKGIGMR